MLEKLKAYFRKPERYVITTNGKVGRVEKEDMETDSIEISFGSFTTEGWRIKHKVQLKQEGISKFITKQEAVKSLNKLLSQWQHRDQQ
jgi:hypothetical protein